MRKLFVAVIGAWTLSSVALAAPCLPGTFFSYAALGGTGCEIALAQSTLNFSNFTLLLNGTNGTGSGVTVIDTNIQITPTGAGTFAGGLQFSSLLTQTNGLASFLVTGTQQYTMILYYLVTGSGVIGTNATMSASVTGGGSASLTKDIFGSTPQILGGNAIATANVNNQQGTGPLAIFNGGASFFSRDTLTIQANNNTATVTSFGNVFQTVPEPMTSLLIGGGLLAIGLLRRRRKR